MNWDTDTNQVDVGGPIEQPLLVIDMLAMGVKRMTSYIVEKQRERAEGPRIVPASMPILVPKRPD